MAVMAEEVEVSDREAYFIGPKSEVPFLYYRNICADQRKDCTDDKHHTRRHVSLEGTSIKEDGYHRIPRDYEKKNTFSNQLIGSNIHYDGKYVEAGLTAVYNVFNKVLNPTPRVYNKYYPRGRDFFNVGINYKVFWKKFTLYGETAMDKNARIATMNTFRYSPKESFQLMVMNRFYDVAYQSIYARSIGEGSSEQNESGFYIGLETSILRYFKLTAYSDFFYFPVWLPLECHLSRSQYI